MARYGMREYIERLERNGDLVAVAPKPISRPEPTSRPRRGRVMGVVALCLPMLAAAASTIPSAPGQLDANSRDPQPTCELTGDSITEPIPPLRTKQVRTATPAARVLRKLRVSRT